MTALEIETKLKESFPDAKIKLTDLTGGGDHWQLNIESIAFAGKSLIEQHQMVYRPLMPWMNREIHALSISTSTPQ